MNEQGLQRALTKKKLSSRGMLALTASKTFLAKNQRRTFEENVQAQRALAEMYRHHQVPLEYIGLMAAFGCNFEGDISISTVLDLIGQMDDILVEFNSDARTLVLADTMAWATPEAIRRVVAAVQDRFPKYRIGLHLHDTRGMGIANAYAGLQMGIDLFDAAVAGLGGCPFAAHRGAAGNVCTEDLVFMCEEMGIETGIDLDRLIESALLAEDVVGHPLPGSVMKGGSLRKLRARMAAAS
jgi:hydroxymethylglutaryl-CoA lyase